jgi:tetratricopeptide (TPR) repeat protein
MAALAALSLSVAAAGATQAGTITLGTSNATRCMQAAVGGDAGRTALDICDAALGEELLDPSNRAGTLVNRGVIHMNRRDMASAIADFEAALALNPQLPEGLMNRGSVRIAQGRYQEALADTETALKLGVAYPERAFYNRALVREELRDTRGAYKDYSEAARLKPGWELPRLELARFSVQRR